MQCITVLARPIAIPSSPNQLPPGLRLTAQKCDIHKFLASETLNDMFSFSILSAVLFKCSIVTLFQDSPIKIEATSTGSNSTISKIVNMVNELDSLVIFYFLFWSLIR